MPMKSQAFSAVVGVGHTETRYLVVPFEPLDVWPGITKVKIPRPDDPRGGQGYLVSGTMNGREFTGHIGQRYGATYMILNDTLLGHIGATDGDRIDVVVAPLPPPPSKESTPKTTKKKTTKKKAKQKKASR